MDVHLLPGLLRASTSSSPYTSAATNIVDLLLLDESGVAGHLQPSTTAGRCGAVQHSGQMPVQRQVACVFLSADTTLRHGVLAVDVVLHVPSGRNGSRRSAKNDSNGLAMKAFLE